MQIVFDRLMGKIKRSGGNFDRSRGKVEHLGGNFECLKIKTLFKAYILLKYF